MSGLVRTLPLLVLGCVLAACSGGGLGGDLGATRRPSPSSSAGAALAGVEERLRGEADFERLEVGYVDSVDNAGLAVVDGYCRDCDEEALAELAARLVWRSEVAPLRTLSVSVTDTATSTRARAGGIVATDAERLTDLYGERSVPTDD